MNTSFAHLPADKQHDVKRIAEIIREIVNPEIIILFGVFASDFFAERPPYSSDFEYPDDFDFLVVTKEKPDKAYVLESTIMDRVDRDLPRLNLEIHSIDYVNDGLSSGQDFFADIIHRGVLLFDTGSVAFSEPRMVAAEERRTNSRQYFDLWYSRSTAFFTVAEHCLIADNLNVGAFTLHQAAESLYFAVLLVFTGFKPRLHNLGRLRRKAKRYSKELFLVFRPETDESEEHLFELLRRGYVDARYKDDYGINKEELSLLLGKIKAMRLIVERICAEKISSFG